MKRICPLHLLFALAFATSLSITSAVDAQVNGPGVSPAETFNTVINIPSDPDFGDSGFIGGVPDETTQLNLSSGGSIGPNFSADFGSEVNVSGGNIGSNFSAANSEVNISGGNIETMFTVANSAVSISGGTIVGPDRPLRAIGSEIDISGGIFGTNLSTVGSTVNISGGRLENGVNLAGQSTANITGGDFGNFFLVRGGSEANITGGNFGFNPDIPDPAATPAMLTVATNGTLNISGGTFEGNFLTANGSGEVNLLGTEFFVGGVRLDPLQLDDPFLIADRGVTLSGTLLDGSTFDFFLGPSTSTNDDLAPPRVTVSTVSVPEPSGLAMLLAGGFVGLLVRRRK